MQDKQPNAGDERAAHDAPIEAISADRLADVLRRAGYRVTAAEQNGAVQLMSASQGIGFAVRFGNPAVALAPQGADATPAALPYIDYTLSCVLQVQGELRPSSSRTGTGPSASRVSRATGSFLRWKWT
ncbi:hypothetical protein CSX04_06273 [Burkholderia cepacia]|nr:hypothetical protein CSX04_06273 [Burkholderia cepacia]